MSQDMFKWTQSPLSNILGTSSNLGQECHFSVFLYYMIALNRTVWNPTLVHESKVLKRQWSTTLIPWFNPFKLGGSIIFEKAFHVTPVFWLISFSNWEWHLLIGFTTARMLLVRIMKHSQKHSQLLERGALKSRLTPHTHHPLHLSWS